MAGLFAAVAIFVIFGLAIALIVIVAEWFVYSKAGKPGWAVLIPIYNIIVLLDIIGKPWWWIFLFMIPFVNIIFAIIMMHQLSLSFGKDAGFTVGLVILPFIFVPILGFGSAKYLGPGGAPPQQPAQ